MAPPRGLIGITELAAAFGVTREWIRQWRAAGMPERTVSGRPMFSLRECIAWRRERDQLDAARAAHDNTKPDKDDEAARKLAAEASLAELKLATQRAELVPSQLFREELERVIGGFSAVALGRLQRFERDIVQATTPPAARKLVERMQDALMEGAQAYADELESDLTDEAA